MENVRGLSRTSNTKFVTNMNMDDTKLSDNDTDFGMIVPLKREPIDLSESGTDISMDVQDLTPDTSKGSAAESKDNDNDNEPNTESESKKPDEDTSEAISYSFGYTFYY